MTEFDRASDLEAQIDALDDTFDTATNMAAAFNAELAKVRESFGTTGYDVATLDRGLSGGLRKAIKGAVQDGDSLSQAMDTLANTLINTAFNAAVNPVADHFGGALANGIGNLVGGLLPFAKGASFSQGRVQPFANGGVVSSPTTFPMRGGTGLMGEAGPEAIMPLARGADGKLGVRGAGGGTTNVVMNINTPDAESFRRSQGQIAAQMGRALGRGQRNR
ncbi:phage tail tape measure protein [Roseovarius sp. 2305UL8-3]|uniref:phage tail tape measure protein n=1 Tax=Roseovarius conchicola TaxID=3121636 RepID=UPI003528857A